MKQSVFFKHKWDAVRNVATIGAIIGMIYVFLVRLIVHDVWGWAQLPGAALVGATIGGLVAFVEEFVIAENLKRLPFIWVVFTRTLIFSAIVAICLMFLIPLVITDPRFGYVGHLEYYWDNGLFARDFSVAFVGVMFVVMLLQIRKLLGANVLSRFIIGAYHTPQYVERIFLFVDLNRSTTLAEQLGDLAYSRFLQDYFFHLNEAVSVTKGEIYQYVGDEIVVSWPVGSPEQNAFCVDCFDLMFDRIAAKAEHYQQNYGFMPTFKAGAHIGKAVMSWVGEIKRETVFHGDVLNTTARIMAQCSQHSASFLISDTLYHRMKLSDRYIAESLPAVELRGKAQPVGLVKVEKGVAQGVVV